MTTWWEFEGDETEDKFLMSIKDTEYNVFGGNSIVNDNGIILTNSLYEMTHALNIFSTNKFIAEPVGILKKMFFQEYGRLVSSI